MNAIWNNYKLQQPPNLTWRTNKNTLGVKKFLAVINKAIRELESTAILDVEATFLSRLIYRMKNKFRSDKGLKSMEKVNRALINYLNMALLGSYKDLASYVHVEDATLTLPSRELLEYVLVRTQGFAKLMERIELVARHSAHFLKTRIGLGHAWSVSLIAYANISRIWFLSRQLIRKCCVWYKELYQYVSIFQYVGLPWIPEDQSLPPDLEQWLSLEWMHEDIHTNRNNTSNSTHLQRISEGYSGNIPGTSSVCPQDNPWKNCTTWNDAILKILKGHPVDCANETIAIPESSTTTNEFVVTSQDDILIQDVSDHKPALNVDMDDVGEVINREAFKTGQLKVPERDTKTFSVKKRKRVHIVDDTRTTKEMRKKKKKRKAIAEDTVESRERKKHKQKMFHNADARKADVASRVTKKMTKQKRKFGEKK